MHLIWTTYSFRWFRLMFEEAIVLQFPSRATGLVTLQPEQTLEKGRYAAGKVAVPTSIKCNVSGEARGTTACGATFAKFKSRKPWK